MYLIEQIHLWAVTDFRTFILDHLRPWHEFCEKNYLFDWNSVYNVSDDRKTRRTCGDDENILLPSWIDNLNNASRRKIQTKAKESLELAIAVDKARKGKQKALPFDSKFVFAFREEFSKDCTGCLGEHNTAISAIDHLRECRGLSERRLARLRYNFSMDALRRLRQVENNDDTDIHDSSSSGTSKPLKEVTNSGDWMILNDDDHTIHLIASIPSDREISKTFLTFKYAPDSFALSPQEDNTPEEEIGVLLGIWKFGNIDVASEDASGCPNPKRGRVDEDEEDDYRAPQKKSRSSKKGKERA